tara:strand:+ start:55 stop:279 length:225 start_codon:yes stop_codon:yes gene_type:complete
MDLNEFLELVKETLDAENDISIDDMVEEIDEWDSLGVLSLVSMLDDLGVAFEVDKFEDIITVEDFVKMTGIIND